MLLELRTRTLAFAIVIFSVFLPLNLAAEQPAVAIKEPKIGEGVPSSIKKHLNVSTLWSEMEASFRATRKFRVLSRNKETLSALREEQEFAASDFAKGDAAETGQFDNANYLILPTVQDFKFYRGHKALPNFDSKYKRTDSGLLQVSAQMVDTTTGQIVTTFYMKNAFSTKPEIVNSRAGSPSSINLTNMSKKVSASLADQFVDTVYPMKVVKRSGNNKVFINRGRDGGLKIGLVLNVYSAGEELIDPDTGESLGSSEEYIGQIKVERINPKITIANIIKETAPDYSPIGTGNILRRPQ